MPFTMLLPFFVVVDALTTQKNIIQKSIKMHIKQQLSLRILHLLGV